MVVSVIPSTQELTYPRTFGPKPGIAGNFGMFSFTVFDGSSHLLAIPSWPLPRAAGCWQIQPPVTIRSTVFHRYRFRQSHTGRLLPLHVPADTAKLTASNVASLSGAHHCRGPCRSGLVPGIAASGRAPATVGADGVRLTFRQCGSDPEFGQCGSDPEFEPTPNWSQTLRMRRQTRSAPGRTDH